MNLRLEVVAHSMLILPRNGENSENGNREFSTDFSFADCAAISATAADADTVRSAKRRMARGAARR